MKYKVEDILTSSQIRACVKGRRAHKGFGVPLANQGPLSNPRHWGIFHLLVQFQKPSFVFARSCPERVKPHVMLRVRWTLFFQPASQIYDHRVGLVSLRPDQDHVALFGLPTSIVLFSTIIDPWKIGSPDSCKLLRRKEFSCFDTMALTRAALAE